MFRVKKQLMERADDAQVSTVLSGISLPLMKICNEGVPVAYLKELFAIDGKAVDVSFQ